MEWRDFVFRRNSQSRNWDERNPRAGRACTSGCCFPQPHCLKSVTKLHHKVPGPSKSRHKYLSHFDFKTLKGRKCKTSENLHFQLKTNLCSTWIWETESEFRWNWLHLNSQVKYIQVSITWTFVNKWRQPELAAEFPTLPACAQDIAKAGEPYHHDNHSRWVEWRALSHVPNFSSPSQTAHLLEGALLPAQHSSIRLSLPIFETKILEAKQHAGIIHIWTGGLSPKEHFWTRSYWRLMHAKFYLQKSD